MAPAKRKLAADAPTTSNDSKRSKSEAKSAKKQHASTPRTEKPRPQPQPKTVSILTKEQPAFPRGGADPLTPIERKRIQAQATQDVAREHRQTQDLFGPNRADVDDVSDDGSRVDMDEEVAETAKTRRKEKKTRTPTSTAPEKAPTAQIGGLNFKRITPESLILGQITAIDPRTLTIALPNNLVGFVRLTAVSGHLNRKIQEVLDKNQEEGDSHDSDEDEADDDLALTAYFRVGQYLRVAVTSTEQERGQGKSGARKRLELSVDPTLTNVGLGRATLAPGAAVQVSVHSVEDHGLVVELGLQDHTVGGFVAEKYLPADLPLASIKPGAVLLCSVLEISSNGKVVKLAANPSRAVSLKTAPSIDTFLPGTLAEILLDNITDAGLSGKAMGLLDVTADLVHSGAFKDKEAFLARFHVGQKVRGRLICNFPQSDQRRLGFSVLDHVVKLSGPDTGPDPKRSTKLALSSTIEAVPVIRVEPGLGIYLQLGPGAVGFAHISRLSDKTVEAVSEVSGAFKLGSEHTTRVIDYNPFDDLYLVSLQPSVLQQPYLRFEDVPLGAIVKGTIEKLLVGSDGVQGLLVNLAEGIAGLVPQIHMSDVELSHPERKFREGQAVMARVLTLDPAKKRLRLTLKKTLINSDQKPWLRFEDIENGDSTVGTLTKVDRLGAVVRFYGPVRGFLPVSEMSEAYIKDASEHFRIGQVVLVSAISVNATEKRLTLTCRDVNRSDPSAEHTLASLEIGSLAKGTVFEKSHNDVLLRLEGSDAIARLTLDHISDRSLKKRESALRQIRVGQNLDQLLIWQVLAKRRLVLVSNKASLIKAAQDSTLLTSYGQLRQGAPVTGFVSNITEDGVFVAFAAGISGLIPKSQLPAGSEGGPDYGMTKLQPVTAQVSKIDYKGATPRFWLTMRAAATTSGPLNDADVPGGLTKLVDPVDSSLKSLGDLAVGRITKARVTSVKDTQINVDLAKNLQGRIDVSEVFDQWTDIKDRKRPLKAFAPKQELSVKVLGAHDTRNHRFLPLTHRTGKNTVLELSCKPSAIDSPGAPSLTLAEVAVGSTWIAFVNNVSDSYIWANISPAVRGRIRATDVANDLSRAGDLAGNFPIGSALRVHVLAVDPETQRLDLTARSDGSAASVSLKDLSPGLILPGRVTKVMERNIIVQLSEQVIGSVELIDMADNYNDANPAQYQKNDVLRVCVLSVDVPNKRITLSVRPSKVLSSSMPVTDREISAVGQLAVNDVVRGFVSNVSDKGVFVTLGHGVTAFVRIGHLSDSYLKEWRDHFQRDQLVQGKITLVDAESGHVQMTLKASALDPHYTPPVTFHDLHVGDVVTGRVAKVESFGVFIVVDHSERVRGLCHRSEIAEQRVGDASTLFREGDVVKAIVLKVDAAHRRINFGMKASYFAGAGEDDSASDADSRDDSHVDDGGGVVVDAQLEADSDADSVGDAMDLMLGDGSESEEDERDPDHDEPTGLDVGGFDWVGTSRLSTATASHNKRGSDSAESPDESATERPSKKKRKNKAAIQVDHTGDLDVDGPQSADDFERLLMSEPDSSLLWLQYMAFHLELGDVDQARQIGERGLRSIGLGQESEKLNVWIALLNLENAYGDDDAVEALFKRACEYNDAQDIYARLASIYIHSGKHDKADELYRKMLKRFTQDPKVWVNYATFLFDTQNDADAARDLLPRALQTLPKMAHLDVTMKFAQLEFKSERGLVERGRTIFEGLINSFPKRVDLFNVWLDFEVKAGDADQIRALLERIFAAKLKPRQAKYFFKRWLAFEEAKGDDRRVDTVKARAAEWVRTAGKPE